MSKSFKVEVACIECGFVRILDSTYKYKNPTGLCRECGYKKLVANRLAKTPRSHISIKKTFRNMKSRCYGDYEIYELYKKKNILICDDWLNNVDLFIKWSLDNGWQEGLTIDRIDSDKNYEPSNCRWITHLENSLLGTLAKKKLDTNTSGYTGVWYRKDTNKYSAEIQVNKRKVSLGCYETAQLAASARDAYIDDNNLPHRKSNI